MTSKHRITVDLYGKEGQQLHDLLSYYKLLRQENWTEFVLKSIAHYSASENLAIGEAINLYLTRQKRVNGRPLGIPQPLQMKEQHSKKMKEYWRIKKEKMQQIEL